jgi:hypothetical protein
MAENTKQIVINILISSIWLIIWWYILFFMLWINNSDTETPQWSWNVVSSWDFGAINIVEQFAWDYTISIWENIEEAINSWVRWKDFISIVPAKQPNINKEFQDDNNKLIRTYLSKYKSEFIIPETKTNWYVIFVTSTGIADDRWLFFGVRWKSEWETKKSKFIDAGKSNWYVYDMKNVWVGNYKNWLNLFDLSRNWKIQVWGVVSEDGNKIEEIIMVFY